MRILMLCLVAFAMPLAAQVEKPPKDITGKVDSFTGDTVWATKYGRLDSPNGCGRDNLAIIWKLVQGPHGRMELMTYEYIAIDGVLGSRSRWLGGARAFLNLDGDLVELETPDLGGRRLSGDSRTKEETAAFRMPVGTLQRIVDAKLPKLRIVGTERTCDGIIEPNMRIRIRALLTWMRD